MSTRAIKSALKQLRRKQLIVLFFKDALRILPLQLLPGMTFTGVSVREVGGDGRGGVGGGSVGAARRASCYYSFGFNSCLLANEQQRLALARQHGDDPPGCQLIETPSKKRLR